MTLSQKKKNTLSMELTSSHMRVVNLNELKSVQSVQSVFFEIHFQETKCEMREHGHESSCIAERSQETAEHELI